jgi:hypothetical protein
MSVTLQTPGILEYITVRSSEHCSTNLCFALDKSKKTLFVYRAKQINENVSESTGCKTTQV